MALPPINEQGERIDADFIARYGPLIQHEVNAMLAEQDTK